MRALRDSIAVLLAVALLALGPRTPVPGGGTSDDVDGEQVTAIERADSAPLAYLAEASPTGVVFDGAGRHTSGSARITRIAAPAGRGIACPARVAMLVRSRLGFARTLHMARSGWTSYTTTAPPPFRA